MSNCYAYVCQADEDELGINSKLIETSRELIETTWELNRIELNRVESYLDESGSCRR